MAEPRKVIILAGPNGAGKTTFAREFLAADGRCERFINADLIAAELSPVAPELVAIGAARLMLGEIDGCSSRGESFAFETTLSGTAYVRRIHDWRRSGYHVALYFLRLPSEEAAIARVQRAFAKAATTFPSPSFGAGFARACRISRRATEMPSTRGYCWIIRAMHRCSSTGVNADDISRCAFRKG